ncbi:MAG: hypothetical protein ABIX01_13910 [Chitinophagaceae bacterium]
MKQICLFILLLSSVNCIAQDFSKSRRQVIILSAKHAITANLKDYLDTADIRSIKNQVGKIVSNNILKTKIEKDLAACYEKLLANKRSGLAIYEIAAYTTVQPDEFGYNTEEATYAILEVPANENKNAGGDCGIEKTFYRRIPANDIYHLQKDEKSISIQEMDLPVKDNGAAHSFAALGKINVACDQFNNGIYNGEQTNGMPDGYGSYLFSDSSFYCGSFLNGKVNGNGVMYNAALKTALIGNWFNGRLKGDYYEVRLKEYHVDIYTANGNEPIERAGMWVNEEGTRVGTSNMINVFTNDKRGIYNNLSAYGTMDVMYSAYEKGKPFSKGKTADFYSDRESEIFNMSTTLKYASGTDKSQFERELTYSIPTYLYPTGTINLNDDYYYFGKTAMNKGNGYGSIASKNRGDRLLTAMYSDGKPGGFKQEIFNGKNKFMYAGDFEITGNAHTGTFAKFNYTNPGEVSIQIGSFSNDGNETLDSGINIQLGPTKNAVTFKNAQHNAGRGYIIFPMLDVIYRGELLGVSAEGIGETLQAGRVNQMNYKDGKQLEKINHPIQWITPVFTDIFSKAFDLIDRID